MSRSKCLSYVFVSLLLTGIVIVHVANASISETATYTYQQLSGVITDSLNNSYPGDLYLEIDFTRLSSPGNVQLQLWDSESNTILEVVYISGYSLTVYLWGNEISNYFGLQLFSQPIGAIDCVINDSGSTLSDDGSIVAETPNVNLTCVNPPTQILGNSNYGDPTSGYATVTVSDTVFFTQTEPTPTPIPSPTATPSPTPSPTSSPSLATATRTYMLPRTDVYLLGSDGLHLYAAFGIDTEDGLPAQLVKFGGQR